MSALSSPVFWLRFFGEFRCHRCGSNKGHVSHPRNLFEKYGLRLLFLRTARCGDCYSRSYRPINVRLLPRPKLMEFDSDSMLAATLAVERRVLQAKTSADETKPQHIA